MRLRHAFRRYWAVELWSDVFDSLLNLPDARTRPPCARLAQRIVDHLAEHPGLQQRAQAELAQQASRPPPCSCFEGVNICTLLLVHAHPDYPVI